ncbi:hypothetical protein ACROYT_G043292 [Oculina patagonica]
MMAAKQRHDMLTEVHKEQEFECEDVQEGTEILPLPVERDFLQFYLLLILQPQKKMKQENDSECHYQVECQGADYDDTGVNDIGDVSVNPVAISTVIHRVSTSSRISTESCRHSRER